MLAPMKGPRPFSIPLAFVSSGAFNLVLNAPFAWLVVPEHGVLPLFGLRSIAADLVMMVFGISFGTALVVTLQTRWAVGRGRLAPKAVPEGLRKNLERWPRNVLRRSVNLGVLSLIVLVPPTLLALWALGVSELDRRGFAAWKGGFAFVQGGLVTPLVVIAAMVSWPTPDAREVKSP